VDEPGYSTRCTDTSSGRVTPANPNTFRVEETSEAGARSRYAVSQVASADEQRRFFACPPTSTAREEPADHHAPAACHRDVQQPHTSSADHADRLARYPERLGVWSPDPAHRSTCGSLGEPGVAPGNRGGKKEVEPAGLERGSTDKPT